MRIHFTKPSLINWALCIISVAAVGIWLYQVRFHSVAQANSSRVAVSQAAVAEGDAIVWASRIFGLGQPELNATKSGGGGQNPPAPGDFPARESEFLEIAARNQTKLVVREFSSSDLTALDSSSFPTILTGNGLIAAAIIDCFEYRAERLCLLSQSDGATICVPANQLFALTWQQAINRETRPSGPVYEFGPARIRVNRLWASVGPVLPGETKDATFVITNESGAPILLQKMHLSCGCVGVDPAQPTELAAGESKEVRMSLKGGSAGRPIHQNGLAEFCLPGSDEALGYIRFDVYAWEPAGLKVQPEALHVGARRTSDNSPIHATLKLQETQDDRFAVESVALNGVPLEYRLTDSATSGLKEYSLEMTLRPGAAAQEGPNNAVFGKLFVRTSSALRPLVEIPVTWHLEPDVRCIPVVASFGILTKESGEAHEKRIQVKHLDGLPCRLSIVETPAGFDAMISQEDATVIAVKPKLDTVGFRNGKLRVLAKWDGGEQVLTIPCTSMVRYVDK